MAGKITGVAIIIVLIAAIAGTVFWIGKTKTGAAAADPYRAGKVVVYKSPTCGCCSLYVDYLKSNGFKTIVKELPDLSAIKRKYGVPTALQSCHTVSIDGYFVEGHVPIEAIEKLLNEKPDIAGLALPEMPSGSPGMPGKKKGAFVVFAIDKAGQQKEFISV